MTVDVTNCCVLRLARLINFSPRSDIREFSLMWRIAVEPLRQKTLFEFGWLGGMIPRWSFWAIFAVSFFGLRVVDGIREMSIWR